MDPQTLINIAFTLAGSLGGWVLRNITTTMRDLQTADSSLADKVQSIELLVAGQYVRRDALERMENALFTKLDRIEEKLDKKVDR